jgi:hypothetical protein
LATRTWPAFEIVCSDPSRVSAEELRADPYSLEPVNNPVAQRCLRKCRQPRRVDIKCGRGGCDVALGAANVNVELTRSGEWLLDRWRQSKHRLSKRDQ